MARARQALLRCLSAAPAPWGNGSIACGRSPPLAAAACASALNPGAWQSQPGWDLGEPGSWSHRRSLAGAAVHARLTPTAESRIAGMVERYKQLEGQLAGAIAELKS